MFSALFASIMHLALANPELTAISITFLVNLALGYRSQFDGWAEKNPRAAAILKAFRATGIDPWMLLQSLSLALKKKLPVEKPAAVKK